MTNTAENVAPVIEDIAAIVGWDAVLTDAHSCSLYSQDIYARALPALAIVRPADAAALAKVVVTATGRGHALIARGGGMSYSSGYVPVETGSIILDVGGLDRVAEINRTDMYVTVEAGCTWQSLYQALQETGLRTPYWGPLSGIHATVGGSLSQNSIFLGSGRYGSAADSVLSLEVALADGTILHTGSAAQAQGSPFFRYFGPDLTGLFCGDSGALGVKVKATLPLIPALAARRFASFDFAAYPELVAAMSDIARAGLAMECYGFDPFLQQQRLRRESLLKDMKALLGVMKTSDGALAAVKDGVRTAIAGRGFMDEAAYSLHVGVEEATESQAEARLAEARAICAGHKGRELENSIPKILRANPFTPLNNIVGPQGERWAPIHALVPHSRAVALIDGTQEIFARQRERMEQHGIGVGYLFATVSTQCFVVEPVFFWPDAMTEIHRHTIEPGALAKLPGFAEDLPARRAVAQIRDELLSLFCETGAAHLQLGKAYPYQQALKPRNRELLQGLKKLLDPHNRVNPGALGL